MAVAYWRYLDQAFAEQRLHAAREQGSIIDGNRRLSSLPPRRRSDGLLSVVADFRRVSFRVLADAPSTMPPASTRMFSHAEQMQRLGAVVSAVRDELLHKHPSLPAR